MAHRSTRIWMESKVIFFVYHQFHVEYIFDVSMLLLCSHFDRCNIQPTGSSLDKNYHANVEKFKDSSLYSLNVN